MVGQTHLRLVTHEVPAAPAPDRYRRSARRAGPIRPPPPGPFVLPPPGIRSRAPRPTRWRAERLILRARLQAKTRRPSPGEPVFAPPTFQPGPTVSMVGVAKPDYINFARPSPTGDGRAAIHISSVPPVRAGSDWTSDYKRCAWRLRDFWTACTVVNIRSERQTNPSFASATVSVATIDDSTHQMQSA